MATLNANSVKKQRINAKSEPAKCSGLAISRCRQIYARIGVELRPKARKGHICEGTFAYGSYSSKDTNSVCVCLSSIGGQTAGPIVTKFDTHMWIYLGIVPT